MNTAALTGRTILIAEDNETLRGGLVGLLKDQGATTLEAEDGGQALDLFRDHRPDLCLIDIMMEQMDGFQLCAAIRAECADRPIIVLSARRDPSDRVMGLELGADDYMVKPFDPQELIARIRAVLRRQRGPEAVSALQMDDLLVEPVDLRARRDGAVIELSRREVKILQLLFMRKGRATSRDDLLDFCWGVDHLPNSRVLDQAITVLRRKIERDPEKPRIIQTVRGAGYRFGG
ncbi:MAG: response regulator transcription factor [Magnetovibrionaceae bacterium]